jgi:hypothetical protein
MSKNYLTILFLQMLLASAFANVAPLSADEIKFVNGTSIRASSKNDLRDDNPFLNIETASGLQFRISKAEIESSTNTSILQDEYVMRERLSELTVESQWELADWCHKNGMSSQRTEHLQLILQLDPHYVPAHKALGHIQQDGKWVDRDAYMAEKGFVKYKGKYLTPLELALAQEMEITNQTETAWMPKIRLWVGWLNGGNASRIQNAQLNLLQIKDPNAVRALAQLMSTQTNPEIRKLYVTILCQINSELAIENIVRMAMLDFDDTVRQQAIDSITAEQVPSVLRITVPFLKSPINTTVRKAAYVLGQLKDPSVVPALIEALVTVHRYDIQVNTTLIGVTYSFAGNDGLGVASGAPLPPEINLQLNRLYVPYGARNYAYIDPVTGYRYNRYLWRNPNLYWPRYYRESGTSYPTTMDIEQQNVEVHDALVNLTNVDYGFAVDQWWFWLSSQTPVK